MEGFQLDKTNDRQLLTWGLLLLCALSAAGMSQFSTLIAAEGWLQLSAKLQIARLAGWAGVAAVLAVTLYAFLGGRLRLLAILRSVMGVIAKLRWPALVLGLVLLAAYPYLIMSQVGLYFTLLWTRLAVFAWLVVLEAALLAAWRRSTWLEALALSALALGVAYNFASYIPHVSNSPFMLGWSETSRYYLASTFFSERIYGVETPWVFRDTTRYLMQAVPFLFSNTPLWVHRLWQALMRFVLPYLTGWVIARRLKLGKGGQTGLFALWAGLFIFQGPVFYPMMVIVMVAAGLAETRHFWKTLIVVVLISFWAGLTRINWVPMPGLMATVFYLLETPLQGKDLKAWLRYLWQPLAWTLAGSLTGVAAQTWYAANSGNIEGVATSSFTSDLIWSRLFPNISYAPGILLSIIMVSAPLLVYLALSLRGWKERYHWLRLLGLLAITAVLFAGGLVVSVKIGGGTNLHNMDVFLVVLLLLAAWLYSGKVVAEDGQTVNGKMPSWLLAAVVAAPVIFSALYGGRVNPPLDEQTAQAELAKLQAYVDQAAAQGGEVLFVAERHLITFGYITGVDLVYDYEKMELMDNTMAGNQAYLEAFARDMQNQRFALIIHDHLPSVWKNPDKAPLAAENNVYFKQLVPLILCAYQEETRLVDGTLDVLVPKAVTTCE